MPANISSFEVDDSVLENLREYSLANSLYWALAEGHACEQSARRNAMDVSFLIYNESLLLNVRHLLTMNPTERFQERW